MNMAPDDNPFTPPTAPLGVEPGEQRFYGLAVHQFKFSQMRQLSKHPLVWLYLLFRRPLTNSADLYVSGVVNPQDPTELKISDFDPHIKERLAVQHPALREAGFQFVGFYNGPAFGLAKNVGELWISNKMVCLNLLIQTVALRREKRVQSWQSFLSWRENNHVVVTTNIVQKVGEDPVVEDVSLPQADVETLLRHHRQRLQDAIDLVTIDADNVWAFMHQLVRRELRNLETQGLLQAVNPKQLQTLIGLSQFIDFRDRTVPLWVRAPLSLKVPLYLWVGILISVVLDRPVFSFGLVLVPMWWLFVWIFSGTVFRYWMAADPQDRSSIRDYFHYLPNATRQGSLSR